MISYVFHSFFMKTTLFINIKNPFGNAFFAFRFSFVFIYQCMVLPNIFDQI